ncbi:DUF4160 domain-containing protein [Candidatus Saccharibacteria bacterium]|nr:DUF4160 domain-containing protein [Candidatus Saccharibacteria bacterium]
MRGDYDIPRTGLKTTFDHCRDDYYGSHGLHVHVKDHNGRIASVNLHSLTIQDGSLDGKEGRLAMEWIRDNAYMLRSDAEYWRDNGAISQ